MDFTVAEFLAFARSKPADERYDFCNSSTCAVAQFGLATGRPELVGCSVSQMPDWLSDSLNTGDWDGPEVGEYSWGGLVTRLEAIVQESPVKPSIWLTPQTYVDADVGEYVK